MKGAIQLPSTICSTLQSRLSQWFAEFISDRKLYRAVERELEIIGEAANRVSKQLRAAQAKFPGQRSSARDIV